MRREKRSKLFGENDALDYTLSVPDGGLIYPTWLSYKELAVAGYKYRNIEETSSFRNLYACNSTIL